MAEVPVRLALPAPHTEQASLLMARFAAFIVAIIGAVILFAWQFSIPELTETVPGTGSMTPAAAAGTIAAAAGLFCFTFRLTRPLARLINLPQTAAH